VITTLLKKGLTENSGNNVVGVIKRRNGCSTTVSKKPSGCSFWLFIT